MEVVRPELRPDASLSRAEMEQLQHEIAAAATFGDDFETDPTSPETRPVVAGVDQAFDDGRATSAVVALQGGEVVERVHATEPTEIPYVPGLLSFREGGAILSALECLTVDPDLVMVDGSGRIHFREAGLATHVGVALDVPTVGVAKSLLCGRPQESLEGSLPEGTRVPVEADESVTATDGTVIGHAVQTRQYDSDNRYINPVYTSPGHRVGADTAAELVDRHASGYKLPEPTRLADEAAGEVT